jgi:hypothetical protein
VTNARAYYTPRAAAGALDTRLSLRPLFSLGETIRHSSDASRRENAVACPILSVIAKSDLFRPSSKSEGGRWKVEEDKAIHPSLRLPAEALKWFHQQKVF